MTELHYLSRDFLIWQLFLIQLENVQRFMIVSDEKICSLLHKAVFILYFLLKSTIENTLKTSVHEL